MIYLKLLLTTLFWGGTFVAARYAVREAPPFAAAACRFAVATAVLMGLLAWRRRVQGGPFPRPRTARQWLGLSLLGLSGIFLYNAAFFGGLRYTTAVNASLIVAVNPALTAVLAALWLGERPRKAQAAGFLVSFLGVVWVVSRGSWEALARLSFNRGDLIILAAPFCWAFYTVLGSRTLGRFSPLAATAWAALLGGAMLGVAAVVESRLGAPAVGFSLLGWLAILQLALLGTVMGFVWWYQGVKELGAARAAVFVNLVPIFAVLLAWLLLGEKPGAGQAAGGLLVLAGVWLVQR